MNSKTLEALSKKLGFTVEELSTKLVNPKDLYKKPKKPVYDRNDGLYQEIEEESVFKRFKDDYIPKKRNTKPTNETALQERVNEIPDGEDETEYKKLEDGSFIRVSHVKEDDYLYPDEEYDYDLNQMLKSSIENYKIAKRENSPFSEHKRDLF